MKKKIAIYGHNIDGVLVNNAIECADDGTSWADRNDEYMRLTETVEVEFKEIPREEVMNKKVKIIDDNINRLEGQIEALKNQKKELLCIEHQEVA